MELSQVNRQELLSIVERFNEVKILIVGDIMVDEYIWGSVSRVSPEAPVPIVTVNNVSRLLGGAANVLNNVYSLSAKVTIAGVVGDDDLGKFVRSSLESLQIETDGVVTDPARTTTIKTRIIAHNQQIVRVDREDIIEIPFDVQQKIIEYIQKTIPEVDAVIISDYGKGVICERIVTEIVSLTNKHNKICSVDPKVNHFDLYKGVTIITPNHKEAAAAIKMPIKDHKTIKDAGFALMNYVGSKAALITWGEHGMALFENNGNYAHIPTMAKTVFDVTGAGDTVVSTLTVALAANGKVSDAAIIANCAAGLVVKEFGTAPVRLKELKVALAQDYWSYPS